jgi:hypothetical protein
MLWRNQLFVLDPSPCRGDNRVGLMRQHEIWSSNKYLLVPTRRSVELIIIISVDINCRQLHISRFGLSDDWTCVRPNCPSQSLTGVRAQIWNLV